MSIRIALSYQGKKAEGAHQFKVEFYNSQTLEKTKCMLDIEPNKTHIYPEAGKESFDIPSANIEERERVMEMTSSLGKAFVDGLERNATYFWIREKG